MGSSVILPVAGQPTTGPDPGFKSAAQPNIVSFRFQDISPPSPLYIQRDDQLLVTAFSSIAGEIVTITWRELLPVTAHPGQPDAPAVAGTATPLFAGGTIQPAQRVLNIPSAFVQAQALFALSEGYLLGIDVSPGAAVARGRTYVRVEIARGAIGTLTFLQTLFSDYISGMQHGGWPGGRIIHPAEGTGFLRSVTVATPAAGADWIQVVPGTTRWRLISTQAQLVTSAAVANRIPELQITDGVQSIFQGNPSASVPASQTVQVSGTEAAFVNAANVTDVNVQLPPGAILPATFVIASKTTNIQAADQWSLIRLFVEEYLDG